MGQISYEAFQANKEERENRANSPRVGYLALKNDGDEALVRFMHNSPADFDILYTHDTYIGGKFRNVSCIRDPKEPVSNCPMCAAGKPIRTKIYIHVIEYTKNENGEIVATPKLWERSSKYISILKTLCDEYPPLSDNMFKIKRTGVAGSQDTTYSIIYANPQIYRADLYKKDDAAFANVKALGTAVLNKDYAALEELVNNGDNAQSIQTPTYTKTEPAVQPAPSYAQSYQPQPAPSVDFTQQQPRTYNPGQVYVSGQDNTQQPFRPRRLD